MNRRRFLAGVASGILGGVAGCFDAVQPPRASNADITPTFNVPEAELKRGALRDAIPALVEPAFAADWEGVEVEVTNEFGTYTATPRLADTEQLIGIERAGEARAYPLRVLNWHEVVNDRLGGPLLVTYCPLCGSGLTAIRRVRGRETVFGVSGLLWKSNLVMYDRETESLWSQVEATAIRGPATGETLELVPSTLTTWGEWRDTHPKTDVLLPPPFSNSVVGREYAQRDYTLDPYGAYAGNREIRLGRTDFTDDRLHPKEQVLGIQFGGEARAYPRSVVSERDVVNDCVGGFPVVVTVAPGGALVGYDRRANGRDLRFEPDGPRHLRANDSRWERSTGRAVAGPHEGHTLDRATDVPSMFWFSWLDFHPETTVYGVG